ncbi:MAG: HDOD domain-containing protein, partial [Acidobacteria bacterium]|nr:HDOD domain-containing protein [Acidobacteriota bacterium]
ASASDRPWAIKSLPPFPAVALQLMGLLDDDDIPMKQVVTLLRMDPALSAEILRVSNSALYGLSRRIDNVSHAVVVLGTDSVKRLALTVALGRFSQRFLKDKALRHCWDHAVATALVCERLAGHTSHSRDRAYTAGLLLDIGRLALLACYPSEYGNLIEVARENDFDQIECERQLFDIDHCAAGEWLGRHWNLPDDLVDAIATHHSRTPNDASTASLATAADQIADALGFSALHMPPGHTIEETLASMPVADMETTIADLSSMEESIRTAISAISPA